MIIKLTTVKTITTTHKLLWKNLWWWVQSSQKSFVFWNVEGVQNIIFKILWIRLSRSIIWRWSTVSFVNVAYWLQSLWNESKVHCSYIACYLKSRENLMASIRKTVLRFVFNIPSLLMLWNVINQLLILPFQNRGCFSVVSTFHCFTAFNFCGGCPRFGTAVLRQQIGQNLPTISQFISMWDIACSSEMVSFISVHICP